MEAHTESLNYQDLILEPSNSDPNARSYIGGISTTIYFVNDLPSGSIGKIYQIDYHGDRILWGDSRNLPKSGYFEVTAYTYQPWEVVFSHQGETVTKIYYPAIVPACVMLNTAVFPIWRLGGVLPSSDPSPRSHQERTARPTVITFENHLQIKVEIRWLGYNGERHHYASILPGLSSRQDTYVGHVWEVVTADYEKEPIVLFYAAPHEGIAEINNNFLSVSGQTSG
ncbi:hypothetical protein J132_08359 [Termitomyces sp. J132]|nr:hypothetical protein J132_08359 [Termitomyces sp. J132]